MRTQKRPVEFGFDRYDKARLRKALTGVTDKRSLLRLKAVLLVAEGIAISTVAKLFDKNVQSIYQWVHRYLKQHRALALLMRRVVAGLRRQPP